MTRQSDPLILHTTAPDELKEMIRNLIREEFALMNIELQRVMGDDDLVSTGSACRILGVCAKVLKVLVDDGHFTVFHHLKEKRYSRGELLDYRNKYMSRRRKEENSSFKSVN